MGLIQTLIFTIALVYTHAQTTQSLTNWPWFCMCADSDPSTGTAFAKIDLCRWEDPYYVSQPASTTGGTIGFGQDLCLSADAAGENVTFQACGEGVGQQRWQFRHTGSFGATQELTAAGGPEAGQLVLMDTNVNDGLCLSTPASFYAGYRLSIKPCQEGIDAYEFKYQNWVYLPLPPENKTLLVMPAILAAGDSTCFGLIEADGYIVLQSECNEALAGNWWVREAGGRIRSAAGNFCLTSGWGKLTYMDCEDVRDQKQLWNFEETSGALTLASGNGCASYTHDSKGHIAILGMSDCNGGEDQRFGFVSSLATVTDGMELV